METKENVIYSCSLGSVSDKRVVLNSKSRSEDIFIKNITSIAFNRKRNYVIGMIGFLFAIGSVVLMAAGLPKMGMTENSIVFVFMLFCLLAGLANWIGHHNIVIGISGIDRKPIKVEIAKTKEGREMVSAIQLVLVK